MMDEQDHSVAIYVRLETARMALHEALLVARERAPESECLRSIMEAVVAAERARALCSGRHDIL